MKSIRVISLAAALAILAGCASPSFTKPAPDKLTLGKSTQDEVIRSVTNAQPTQRDATVNGEKIHLLTYMYGESPKFWGLLIKRRAQTYTLFDGILVGDEYNSTFDGESTDFNNDKIALIEKGKTTRSEVISLLGKQAGEVLYPLVPDKHSRGLVYEYTYSRFAGVLTTTNSKILIVALNENNVVENVSFKINGVEQTKQ